MEENVGWVIRVPEALEELEDLWAQCRRHGVEPGDVLRVTSVVEADPGSRGE